MAKTKSNLERAEAIVKAFEEIPDNTQWAATLRTDASALLAREQELEQHAPILKQVGLSADQVCGLAELLKPAIQGFCVLYAIQAAALHARTLRERLERYLSEPDCVRRDHLYNLAEAADQQAKAIEQEAERIAEEARKRRQQADKAKREAR